jgi:integrase/recombinase XerC
MLTLWKRHNARCRRALLKKGIPLDELRFYKRCQCACYVTGVHPVTGAYHKDPLHTTSWETGEKMVRDLVLGENPTKRKSAAPVTVENAIDQWLGERKRLGTGEATLSSMYHALKKVMLEFARKRGLELVTQFTQEDAYQLALALHEPHGKHRRHWRPSTAKRQFQNLRGFFKFAVVRHWLEKDPMTGVEAPKAPHAQVDPYTPAEEDRIDGALANWTDEIRTNSGPWSLRPQTLGCLREVFRDTGLRVSDAMRVHPGIIEVLPSGDGVCTLAQVKGNGRWGGENHREVTVCLRRETIARMESVPWISQRFPFMLDPGEFDETSHAFKKHVHGETRKIAAAFKLVGRAAQVEDCRPHRFRHTFAVTKLLGGYKIEDVSRLLGHKSVTITEKYYGKWTRNRQDRLRDQVLADWQAERAIPKISPSGPQRAKPAAA